MLLAEVADRPKVRLLHCGHRHEIDPLLAGLGYPARRVDPLAIREKQKGCHHGRVIGREAPFLGVAIKDFRKIEGIPDGVAHQMSQVPFRHHLADRGREQPRLVHIPGTEGFAHVA